MNRAPEDTTEYQEGSDVLLTFTHLQNKHYSVTEEKCCLLYQNSPITSKILQLDSLSQENKQERNLIHQLQELILENPGSKAHDCMFMAVLP